MSLRSSPLARRWGILTAGLFFLLLCLSCSPQGDRLHKETRLSLYTIVTITVSSDSDEKAAKAIDSAFREMERVAGLLNYYSPESELSLINRSAGIGPVKVSPETMEIMERALFVARSTEGAFDVTMGPVIALWDFQKKVTPEGEKLREALRRVGYSRIILDRSNSTVYLSGKGMEINLGGIIKGYLADKAVATLKSEGIKAGIIAIGGDIKAFGKKPGGEPWTVGIQNPRQKGGSDEVIATIRLSDTAVSTAGDYEKFFVKDGRWYHHILDPRTGYPAYGCRNVTVLSADGVMADGIDTGIFIMGPQRGIELLKRLGLDGVIIDNKGAILMTDGMQDKIKLLREE